MIHSATGGTTREEEKRIAEKFPDRFARLNQIILQLQQSRDKNEIDALIAEATTIFKNRAKIEDESSIRKIGEDFIRKIGEVDINIRSDGTGPEQDPSSVTDALRYHGAILKDLPKEPLKGTTYTAYLKKTALITMSLEARLPDETTRLLSGNFEEADEAVSLFFGYMVSCGFHPGSVTRSMREFLDSCDDGG